jgi:hypothetical protein
MWDFSEMTSLDVMAELMHFTRYAAPDGYDNHTAFTQ